MKRESKDKYHEVLKVLDEKNAEDRLKKLRLEMSCNSALVEHINQFAGYSPQRQHETEEYAREHTYKASSFPRAIKIHEERPKQPIIHHKMLCTEDMKTLKTMGRKAAEANEEALSTSAPRTSSLAEWREVTAHA